MWFRRVRSLYTIHRPILTSKSVTVEKSTSKPQHARKRPNTDDGAKAKNKPKLKTVNDLMKTSRRKAPAKPEDEDEAMSAAENEGNDDIAAEEEDDFLVSDGEESKAATKNAQLALSRIIDVDIEGGWKVGSP